MKFKNKTQMMMTIGALISLIFLFIYPSVSFGLIAGFGFSYLNLVLVYKNMDNVFEADEGVSKVKVSAKNSIIRYGFLAIFVYITVHYPFIFNIVGIGIGMFLALVGSVLDTRKKNSNNG